MCGHAFSDRLVQYTFDHPSMRFPCLTFLSLKGAYFLLDVGLSSFVHMYHLLNSVDLIQCSLLSEAGINTLVDILAPEIKELRLESC